MLLNYIKIALRNFWKNPLYSSINVVSLSMGMTCLLLVVLFVKDEFSFDKFHQETPYLYRLTTTVTDKHGEKNTTGGSGQVQGPAFKGAIPEIQDYVRFWNVGGFNIIGEQKAFILQGLFADSNFFKMLTFPLLRGNPQTALSCPYSIVVTESTALKYFGRSDVIGRVLKIEEQGHQPLTITAVAKDPPANSSIRFEVLLPFQFLETFFKDANWLNQYLTTIVLLHPEADPRKVEKKFLPIFRESANDQLQDPRKSEGYSTQIEFGLQPISQIHLSSNKIADGNIWQGSSYATLYTFSGIAIFILVMACINFVNLGIAHSLKRTKEIGIRKISGSTRSQIVSQFLIEAAILCISAFFFALIFSQLLLPLFNSLTGRQLNLDISKAPEIWISWLAIILISVLMAGLYPALVLSRFKAVEVLYNRQKPGGKHWFGKSLVVFQFTLAICLIIGTMIFYLQMRYVFNKHMGFNPSGVISIDLPPQRDPDRVVKVFRNELSGDPSVVQVAGSSSWGNANPVKTNEKMIESYRLRIDEYYLPALEIPVVFGRNFSTGFTSDSSQSVLVNESFVRAAGWKDPIGQRVKLIGEWEGDLSMTVIGVVTDYHYSSLKEKIGPQIMVMKHYGKLSVKLQKGKELATLTTIEKIFKKHIPEFPFQFSFLDDDIRKQYSDEKRWQLVISYATTLSIFICCLGLFGLSYLAVRRRTREIGIRKVLGASIAGVTVLLSKDFLRLVVFAFLLASPLSWIFMNNWLENFAYRIDVGWWIFLAAGIVAVFIALATISFQSIKAAMVNPVKSLRTE